MPQPVAVRIRNLSRRLLSVALIVGMPVAAHAQNRSEGYKFREAVRGEDGKVVQEMLDAPGTTVINSKSPTNGETALHIAIEKGNPEYVGFLLARRANPDVRDYAGKTPLLLAVEKGRGDLVDKLIAGRADVNFPNGAGETALIRAVQRRDLEIMSTLLAAGANPDKSDNQTGMSARDYARDDRRTPALLKLIDDTPKKPARAVAGPKF